MRKRERKRIFSAFLAAVMIFSFVMGNSYVALAQGAGAKAENYAAANTSRVKGKVIEKKNAIGSLFNYAISPSRENVSKSEGILITLGTQTIVREGVYSFEDAEVTGEGIRSIVVSFTEQAKEGDTIILPSMTGFSVQNETANYKIIKVAEGTTTEQVQGYIRAITFTMSGSSKEIMITASKSVVNYNTYYNYVNKHFYQFIPDRISWTDAYRQASNMSFAGRRGYLATITNINEDKFVKESGNAVGWLGGTRLTYYSSSNSFNTSNQNLSPSESIAVRKYPWYWACGPEKGKTFTVTASGTKKPFRDYTGWFKKTNFFCDFWNTDIESMFNADCYYKNWQRGRDYNDWKPVYGNGSCLVLQTYGDGNSTGSGHSWANEAYNATGSISGYYVEYGDKTVGDSMESDGNTDRAVLRKMYAESKPYINIDFAKEQLKGFTSANGYTIWVDGQSSDAEVDPLTGTVAIDSEWFGKTLYISAKGDGSLTYDSEQFVLEIPSRPATPTGVTGYNRTLSGVNVAMEYRAENDTEWTKVTGSKVQRLQSGYYHVRISATAVSFKSNESVVEVLDTGATISVNVSKKVDVALAVGSTGVDYSNFKEDLLNYIQAHYPTIKLENLNIMSTNAVDTSGKSEFTWLQFDHSNSSSIYNASTNPFIQNVNVAASQATNAYNSKNYHIVSADSGTKLTFYGYGSSAYSDFMLLENDQETKKSFRFAIKEYFAADALYGTGFFFNCNMKYASSYASKEAAYEAKNLFMDGYLVALEYTGNSASQLAIYQFSNLNLYNFHNATSGYSDIFNAMKNSGASVTSLASLAVNNSSGPLKSTDDLRKFRIDVSPTSVMVYYKGFDDTSHSVTPIDNESSASKFSTTNSGYVNFTNQKYEELPLVLSATLPTRYKGSDFGPMTKYGGHGCTSLTKVELSELSMTMEMVRSLSETLREPKWRANTDKFLINLNEDPINDFENVGVTAELLNRLQNDDIYYIGWCSNLNAEKSQEFLNKNNLKGGIININTTEYNTYDNQIAKIAELIYNRYVSNSSDTAVIALGLEKEVSVAKAEVYNSADEDWPNGKWRIDYYSDVKGENLQNVTWMSDFSCDFDKIGVYKIYYAPMDGDEPIKVITTHTVPEAGIKSVMASDGNSAELEALVSDEDGNKDLEFEYTWTYKDLGTKSSLESNPVSKSLGTSKNVTLTLESGHMYMVTLGVKDSFGQETFVTKQISAISSSDVKIPPTSFFTLTESNIITNGQNKVLTLVDSSYDPMGTPITKWTFKLYNVAADSSETITPTKNSDGNYEYTISSTLTSGEYAIGLVVSNSNGTSNEIKRFFNVVNDTTAPTVTPDRGAGVLPIDVNSIKITLSDEGGSGFKQFRYCISKTTVTPAESDWTSWSQVTEKNIEFPMENGTYYVHYQLEDCAGNVETNYLGGYVRNQILDTPTELSWSGNGTPVLNWTGDDRIDGSNAASYTVYIYKNGLMFAQVNGITKPSYSAANIVRSGEDKYTFKVQALNDGNPSYTGTAPYFSGKVSELSAELDYKLPDVATVPGGPLDLSAPVTQEKIDDVFGGFAELKSTEPVVVEMKGDVILEESLEISDDIIIDLNGHNITGPSGKEEGESGKPAIVVTDDDTDIQIDGEGEIKGGDGAEGEVGGDGGNAIDFGDTTGGSLEAGKNVDLTGGNGADSDESAGGNGGAAVSGKDVDTDIKGDAAGGDGGNGATTGGNGGPALDTGKGDVTIGSGSSVKGGSGGDGDTGGNGGAGISSDNNTVNISPDSDIAGGDGGDGTNNAGGNGGSAVDTENSDVNNMGNLAGGDGGNSVNGCGGNGGNAINATGGDVTNMDGDVKAGNGGGGTESGEPGQGNNAVNKVGGGDLHLEPIDVNEEMSEEEIEAALAAAERNQQAIDAVFGPGNTIYDPETNTIILLNDVTLTEPITLFDNVNIDLNGFTLKGPDGTEESPDGKPAIKAGSDDLEIGLSNSRPNAGGALVGGNGHNGKESGGNGGSAIDFGDKSGCNLDVGKDVNVLGGDGGNSSSGKAGNGGNGVDGSDVDVTSSGNIAGGNGGAGGLVGGDGAEAVDAGKGNVTVMDGSLKGGDGGKGDCGGNGGTAVKVEGDGSKDSGNVIIGGDDTKVSGGNGGTSVNGQDGVGGDVVDITDGDLDIQESLTGGPTLETGKNGDGTKEEFNPDDYAKGNVAPGGRLDLIPITDNMTEEEAKNAANHNQAAVDAVFGPGNAKYDSEKNTIVIKEDIELSDSIEIDKDINIDLAGHNVTGPSGKAPQPDAKPVIKVTGDDTDIKITDSVGGGNMTGGDGAGTSEVGATGGNGGAVVDFGNTSGGSVAVDKNTNIAAGNGGNSLSGNAGDGGDAIKGDDVDVLIDGTAKGGDGGNSSNGNAGNGGNAVNGGSSDGNPNDIVVNGSAKGGDGGYSSKGNGGNGGSAIADDDANVKISGDTTGGKGGDSSKGTAGDGGSAVEGDNTDVTVTHEGSATAGDGGNSVSGDGGNGGSAIKGDNTNVETAGDVAGGKGGDSTKGTAGDGGSAVEGNNSDVTVKPEGSATAGDGGDTETGSAGDGGNTFEGNNPDVDALGKVAAGKGGEAKNEDEGTGGTNGDVSSDPSAQVYKTETENTKLTFTPDSESSDKPTVGQEYKGTLSIPEGLRDNQYYSELPDIDVYVNGEKLPESDYTYNKETGEVIIPGEKVTGGIVIKERPRQVEVTTPEELKDALEAGIDDIIVTDDITLDEDAVIEDGTKLTIKNGVTLDLDDNDLKVKGEIDVKGDVTSTDEGGIVAGGGKLSPLSQSTVDDVFGKGNALYDPATNTVKLLNDIKMDDSIVIEDDVNIDLNGHDIKEPSGNRGNSNAKPVISVEKDNVDINISDSKGNGSITGGKGLDGTEAGSGNGGAGGDSASGAEKAAGAGGSAIKGDDVDVEDAGNIAGGKGGDSDAGTAGKGGSAVEGDNTEVTVKPEGSATGGKGGNTDTGSAGDGGSAIKGNNTNTEIAGDVAGGKGGDSDTGTAGKGGSAVEGNGSDVTVKPEGSAAGGDGGNTETGTAGDGGNTFEGTNPNVDASGNISTGKGDESQNGGSGSAGNVSSDPTAEIFNASKENTKLTFTPDGSQKPTPGQDYKGTLSIPDEFSDNLYYRELPDIEVYVNGEKLPESDYTYNKETGEVTIPGDKVTGSIIIKEKPRKAEVTTAEQLKDALEAGIDDVVVKSDITLDEDVVIEDGTKLTVNNGVKLDLGDNTMKVEGEVDIKGKVTSNDEGGILAGGGKLLPLSQETVDDVFGKGNAKYDPATNTVRLLNDIKMDDSIVIEEDVNIDLNGHEIKGPSGTSASPDAKPVIQIKKENVELNIKDSAGNGAIKGGNGADATTDGGNGGKGGSIIHCDNNKADINIDATLKAGKGGDSVNGTAGDGGSVVEGNYTDINIGTKGNAQAGDGGNTETGTAGNGGNTFVGVNQNVNVEGKVDAGDGGTDAEGNKGNDGEVTVDYDPVYNVNLVLDKLDYTGTRLKYGKAYTGRLSVMDRYTGSVSMPDSIELLINGSRAQSGNDYTYNRSTGVITVPAESVTGSITIKASGKVIYTPDIPAEPEEEETTDNPGEEESSSTDTPGDDNPGEEETGNSTDAPGEEETGNSTDAPGENESGGNVTPDENGDNADNPPANPDLSTSYQYGEGEVQVNVTGDPEIEPVAGFADAQKAIESIIPKDVLEQIEKGAKLDVEMSVSYISVSVPQEIKTVIEETVKRNAIEEMQIISFMDVKAQYRLNSGEWNILDAVEEDVEIVFTVPKAYLGGSNAFYIVMYVDGVATILTDTDDDEETITIMANPNATFALCSASEVKESVKEMADWKDEFADLIDSDSVSYKDLDAIRTAKEKLDALSDDARALLEKEIGIIDAMYAAAMWYDKYKDIIESDKLTSEDLEMIKEALAEYEKLGDKAASYIDSSIIEKLENFEIHENEESEQDNNTGFAVVIAVIIAMVCAGGVIGIVLYRKRKRK